MMIYAFGTCRVDTARRTLERDNAPVHVEPQVFDLLCFLIANRGRAVTKDEIFDRIWGGRAISEAVLTTRIRNLRKAIDDVGGESMVRTLYRVGYEFRARVHEIDGSDPDETERPRSFPGLVANSEPARAEELRQCVALSLQPRVPLDKPFDPEKLDRLVGSVRRKLHERLRPEDDAIAESADGSVFALLGVQVSRTDDLERAAELALDFAASASGGDSSLAIGIAQGDIARSHAGFRGAAMLLASQTASLASAGDVLITSEVSKHLKDRAETASHDSNVDRLIGLLSAPVPSYDGQSFVGRLVEVGLIESAIQAMVEKGSGGCITLEGVAGVGKTRLAGRAVELLEAEGGLFSIVIARELSADGVLHRNILQGFSTEIDNLDDVLRHRAPRVREQVQSLVDGSIGRSGVTNSEELAQAIIETLQEVSRTRPLIIVIEDAHWLDEESRQLAVKLAGLCSEMQVILLITARGTARDFLDEVAVCARGDIIALSLSPLSARQSRALAKSIAPELSEDTVDDLVERAEGNPLFLTRLLEAFRARGASSFDQVPATIQTVVQVQFDELPAQTRDGLRRCSVLGERFEKIVAETVFGQEVAATAATPGFLREAGAWLQFTHNLVRESVYGTLPQSERRKLHTEAASALVAHDPLLAAEHAMRGDLSVAPGICVKVARDTFHFRRHGRSVALIEEATRLDCTPDQRAQLEIFLGSAAVDLGNEDAAMAHYQNAAMRAESAVPAVFALVRIARLHCRHYRLELATAALDEATGWAEAQSGPGYLKAEIAEMRSVVAWIDRRSQEAIEQGMIAVETSDHPHSSGRALKSLGWAYFSEGRFEDARRCGDECTALVKDKHLRLVEPDVLAPNLRFRWYADPSTDRMEEANAVVFRSEQIGFRLPRVQTRVVRMEIAWELQEWKTFEEDEAVIGTEIVPADRLSLSTFYFFLSLAQIERGCKPPDPPPMREADLSGAFIPAKWIEMGKTLPASFADARATTLETLWLWRLGYLDLPLSSLAPIARDQTANWRQWSTKTSSRLSEIVGLD